MAEEGLSSEQKQREEEPESHSPLLGAPNQPHLLMSLPPPSGTLACEPLRTIPSTNYGNHKRR